MRIDWDLILDAAEGKRDASGAKRSETANAASHGRFVYQLSCIQHNRGRYFAHIHSHRDASCNDSCIRDMLYETGAKAIAVSQHKSVITNMLFMSVTAAGSHYDNFLSSSRWYPWRLCLDVARAIAIQRK